MVARYTGLHLTLDNKFFKEYKDKTPQGEDLNYYDIRIMWEGKEYGFTLEEFKKKLELAP